MRATKRETDEIRAYVESQVHEVVVHLEKAASELVGPVRHDIWDAHCSESRWWVVTKRPLRPGGLQDPRRGVDLPHRADAARAVHPGVQRAGRPEAAELLPGS